MKAGGDEGLGWGWDNEKDRERERTEERSEVGD